MLHLRTKLGNKYRIAALNYRKIANLTFKVVSPLLLGSAILWWMYRDFDWSGLISALHHQMNWWWMLLSLPFGITAQWFRAFRWRQTLEPLGVTPRLNVCTHAIFLSYASSLIVPRVGEVLRCGVLHRYEGTPFAISIGTVVTERLTDTLLVLFIALLAVFTQLTVFSSFLEQTGAGLTSFSHDFSTAGYIVTAVCGILILLLIALMARRLTLFSRTKGVLTDLGRGILSIRRVRHIPLYIGCSIGIWISYYLHLYLTFYCFPETAALGPDTALVAFVVGCFAVLVPTPNGAGPWHFAVKTILILYGIAESQAIMFVLVVHTLQTLLVLTMGIFSLVCLQFVHARPSVAATSTR